METLFALLNPHPALSTPGSAVEALAPRKAAQETIDTTDTMKATYDPTFKTSYTTSHRREDCKTYFAEISVIDPTPRKGEYCKTIARAPITARIYGTGSRNYCCLWINTDGIHTSGSDYAGGYGYHRPSAALGGAIRNAGFTLSESINGVGDSAMEAALLAIAKCIGIKRPLIHRAHP